MKLGVAALIAFGLVACAANGEMKVKASSDESSSASASGEASASGDEKATSSKPATDEAPPPPAQPAQPAEATPPTQAPAPGTCPLVCYLAQHGRVPPADEQKLASDLSSSLSALRSCGPGNSLTLRFDSSGQLTEFGVDAQRGQEGACVDGVRSARPSVSYPGPSTLRCSERCGNPTSTRRTRRR